MEYEGGEESMRGYEGRKVDYKDYKGYEGSVRGT